MGIVIMVFTMVSLAMHSVYPAIMIPRRTHFVPSRNTFDYYEFFAYYRFSVIMYRIIGLRKETGEWPADDDYDVWNLASNILEKEMALRR